MNKKDNIIRYYEAEMRYLNAAAKDFAQAHPGSAKFLTMQDSLERDPMVERLFEGFAFLTAKLYQKIDDDMPELTENMLGLLWPHCLQAIPSMAVVQLQPNTLLQTNYQVIPRGLVLQTAVDAEAKIACEYRTTQDIEFFPVELVQAKLVHNNLGQSIIQLRLQRRSGDGQRLPLPERFSLKVHVVGETETKLNLYHFLLNHLSHVSTGQDMQKRTDVALSRVHTRADSVTWLNDKVATEYDLVMEYFLFKEKFLFFNIEGLAGADFDNSDNAFVINCHLNQDFPLELVFDHQYFKLYCAPAINLFKLEAEPIHRSHFNTSYQLSPMHSAASLISVIAVDEVQSFNQKNGQRRPYYPFNDFRFEDAHLSLSDTNKPYFYLRNKEGVDKRYHTFISFGGMFDEHTNEVVSVSIWGAHNNLPRQIAKINKTLSLVTPTLGVKQAEMMMVPTPIYHPPSYKNQHWQWLFEMSHNYLTNLDANTLKNSLRLLNWANSRTNEKQIAAIQGLTQRVDHVMHKGMMLRCLCVTIELNVLEFINEAEASLFAYILNRFLCAYAQLNLAIRVQVILQPNEVLLSWPLSVNEEE